MQTLRIPKGILKGLDLEIWSEPELRNASESNASIRLERISFYRGTIKGPTFRGVRFEECNFAWSTFEDVTFSRCFFHRVDFTRTSFRRCSFSDCKFVACDPYYSSFKRTEIDPSSFAKCFRSHSEWNKAMLLYADLRRSLLQHGDSRAARNAEYYFRVWQRRRLFHRWRFKRVTGLGPYFWSLCLGMFTGYGEKPIYLAAWALGLITGSASIYKRWLPSVLTSPNARFADYWYYSFKVFFAQGLSGDFQSVSLSTVQVSEFLCGLILVSLLIGSVVRKLSP
jgi:uncharacterized protein YjbI with pentapeptide repeats